MKRLARCLFTSLILLTFLVGLAQATSGALYGSCDQVCCYHDSQNPPNWYCDWKATWCYCPGTTEVTTCWWYCDGDCGGTICLF
jgi:hypothetical protein